MKRILFAALIFCTSISCKKEGAPAPKENLLARVYENDKILCEYEYGAGKRLKKVTKYFSGSGTLNSITNYEYDGSGFLKEKTVTNNSDIHIKYKFECNSSGIVMKASKILLNGVDSGKITNWTAYTYNSKNQLVKTSYYVGDDSPDGYELLEYSDNGGLSTVKIFGQQAGGSKILISYHFNGVSNRMAQGIRRAFIEPDKKDLMYFDAKSFDIKSYNSGGAVQSLYNYSMSGRKSEMAGTISEQIITDQQTWPAASTPDVNKMRYEYVEM